MDNAALLQVITGRGWKIFPCGPDKKPLTQHGFKDASSDLTQIEAWADYYQVALWGIACQDSGFFAVDLDVPDGPKTWQKWTEEHGKTEPGPIQKTPSGGWHILYKLPEGIRIPNNSGKLGAGVDLRSTGYICSGNGYAWGKNGHAINAPLPEAPAWLLKKIEALTTPKQQPVFEGSQSIPEINPTETAGYWLSKFLAKAHEGNRNQTGFDLACQLRDSGIDYNQAEGIIIQYAANVPGTDYTEGEALASLKEAYNRTPRKPAVLPIRKDAPMPNKEVIPPEPEEPPEYNDTWQPFTLADAYKERPPIEYVANGLFALPSLNIIYGPPGCLKSFVMADLALCVASGKLWLPPAPWQSGSTGIQTNNSPVMWLDFDMGATRTHERIEALAKEKKLPIDIPFFYYSMPLPFLDASKRESIGMLALRAKNINTGLIVIDNLGNISGGVDENSGQMIQVMSNLRQLSEDTGAAVIVIHHQRKSSGITGTRAGDSLRGHSSIEASLDLALQCDREEDILTIKSTKTRGVDVMPFSAAFTFEPKENGDLKTAKFWGLEVIDTSSNGAIMKEIKNALTGAAMNKTDLTNAVKISMTGIGVNRIRNCIDKMAADGTIKTRKGDRTAVIYHL